MCVLLLQVNLDFESEVDMIEKFRIGLALQPIAVALFANSPFVEGKPSGMLSTRGESWLDWLVELGLAWLGWFGLRLSFAYRSV